VEHRRLRVVVVDKADIPVAIRACWLSWFVVATPNQADVVRRLGLTDVQETTWVEAVDLIDEVAHSGDERFSTVVVTPAIDGWTLVVGAWFGLPYLGRTTHITLLCREFSSRYGKAQAYFHSEQNDGEAWLIAEDGVVRRRWVSEYPELAMGEPFGVERRLLDAYGITGRPEDLHPDDDLARDWRATWGDCEATTVAAESSLDPTKIGPHTAVSSVLLVARTPSFEPLDPLSDTTG
jgi:hypothetical protein